MEVDFQPQGCLSEIIVDSIRLTGNEIMDSDIVVVAQKIVSKSENRIVDLKTVKPSEYAKSIAIIHPKDPRLIQLILNESKKIVKVTAKHLIVQTSHGFICANAGIDQSNVSNDADLVLLLPKNPDESAEVLQKSILELTSKKVSVIISDTFGRPFRMGQTNVAIGISGLSPLKSYVGTKDSFGKELKVTEIAVADEMASAAELVMGKTSKVPVAIIRGYDYNWISSVDKFSQSNQLIRKESDDLFLSVK